jgi:hypothetical protein
VDAIERFRIAFAGRPLLLFFAASGLIWAVQRAAGQRHRVGRLRFLAAVVGAAAIAAYAAVAIWYGLTPHYFDNAEPTMSAVGWLFAAGKPVYPGVSSPERYAHVYGPAAFMIQGWTLQLFGPSIAVSKFVGVTAGLLSLAGLYGAVRGASGPHVALVAAGLASLALLMFRDYSFWVRPDPLLLLAVSLLLFTTARFSGLAAAVAIGVMTGVLWNLKVTGPCYAAPVFCGLVVNGGVRRVLVAVAIAAAVGAAPFLALENVSWTNYVTWIQLSGRTGLVMLLLKQNVEWAIFLTVPLVAAVAARASPIPPADAAGLLGLLAGMSVVVVAGAKPGAGPYHLIPFIPSIAYLASRLALAPVRNALMPPAVMAAFVLVLALEATANQALLLRTMHRWNGVEDAADVLQFARTHSGGVEMGYGQTEAMSFSRPLLVFQSGLYLVDQPAVREHQLAGVAIPASSAHELDACRVRYWLVPRGELPFGGRNAYTAVQGRPLYSPEFVESFRRNYSQSGTTTYFDVWECRAAIAHGR